MLPKKLRDKIIQRKINNAVRQLGSESDLIDFSSNDYLGFSRSEIIFNKAHQFLLDNNLKQNGATGSRLLSGNYKLYTTLETQLSEVHKTEAALIFNSGYDANIGFFSSVPQRGDIILYDEFSHASIRDGIKLSNAKNYKFRHNDLGDLTDLLQRHSDQLNAKLQHEKPDVYIVTESVFSMDGDSPDLKKLTQLSTTYNAHLIIDEAHALGVFGYGLIHKLNLEKEVFATIITFGKALGCHGAAVLGNQDLKSYLINFSRSFIYTTGLPPHSMATVNVAYKELETTNQIEVLQGLILFFKREIKRVNFNNKFIHSDSAIQCCIIPGSENVKSAASTLKDCGYDVRAILSPTVATGKERLRFCLHSYNSKEEISEVLSLLATFVP